MKGLKSALDRFRNLETIKMSVGIMADKTYPDGTPVAYVGLINELGYSGTVPARKQTIYKSIHEKTGGYNRKGKFVKSSKSNFAEVVDVPAHQIDIPARPFFRHAVDKGSDEAKSKIVNALKSGVDPVEAMRLGGEFMADELMNSVLNWSEPANAKSTIASKGYNAPLRANDKLLRNSFTVEIEE